MYMCSEQEVLPAFIMCQSANKQNDKMDIEVIRQLLP